jgi:hypothetical protein
MFAGAFRLETFGEEDLGRGRVAGNYLRQHLINMRSPLLPLEMSTNVGKRYMAPEVSPTTPWRSNPHA